MKRFIVFIFTFLTLQVACNWHYAVAMKLLSDTIITNNITNTCDYKKQPLMGVQESNIRFSSLSSQYIHLLHPKLNGSPIVAFKTNLLFDLATALNVEIEFPIGKHVSIAGEWIFPWWLNNSKQRCFEVQSGNLEGRLWLGNRMEKQKLTGWFVGLYTGGGYYDIEWNKKGFQGEFFVASGLSGGYAHRIGKQFAMEYSLGIGVLMTRYRKYTARQCEHGDWSLILDKRGRYTYLGPTRAKISLIWIPKFKSRKEGGVR